MSDKKIPQDGISTDDIANIMQAVLEHYSVHHKVISKKLVHAKDATGLSLKMTNDVDKNAYETYFTSWQKIIELFKNCGITQEELFEIDAILTTMPEHISVHFRRLVKLDQMLQTMMKTMEKLNYSENAARIKIIQEQPNPLSGLASDEYEDLHIDQDENSKVKAFIFLPYKPSD